jgi:hypothetical protein
MARPRTFVLICMQGNTRTGTEGRWRLRRRTPVSVIYGVGQNLREQHA